MKPQEGATGGYLTLHAAPENTNTEPAVLVAYMIMRRTLSAFYWGVSHNSCRVVLFSLNRRTERDHGSGGHLDLGIRGELGAARPLAVVCAEADGRLGRLLCVGLFAELLDPGRRNVSGGRARAACPRGGGGTYLRLCGLPLRCELMLFSDSKYFAHSMQ